MGYDNKKFFIQGKLQREKTRDADKITPQDKFALVFILIASLLISLPLFSDFPINTDEGIILDGAVRVLNGEVPYRDFWHITLPGAIWLYALVFKIAGDKFIVARFVGYLFIAGQCILIYLIGKKISKKPVLPLCASIIFFLHISIREVNCEPHIISVFFALLALFLLLSNNSPLMSVLTGSALALSIMAQQNIGAAGLAGVLIIILMGRLRDNFNLKKYLKEVFLITSGLLLVFIPFLFYLIWTNSVKEATYTLFRWPFSNYIGFNKYPYLYAELTSIKEWLIRHGFSLHYLIDISPLIVLGFVPIILIPYIFFIALKERNFLLLSVICYAIMLLFSVIPLRPDYTHLLFVSPLYFFLFFYSAGYFWKEAKNSKIKVLPRTLSSILLLVIFLSFLRSVLLYKSMATTPELELNTARGKVSITYHTPSWMYDVLRYIEGSTKKDESIFIYHWSPVLYFLTGRRNPTPFDTFKPIYNTDEQMQQIIEALKLYRPRLIIKDWYIDPEAGHPNRNMFPGVDWRTLLEKDPVNKYIEQNYELQGYIGSFKIFRLPE